MFGPIHLYKLLRKGLLALLVATATLVAHAQIAQTPLLTQSGRVEPNLMLIFDDSGSMDNTYIYQYGAVDGSGNGLLGPSGGTSIARYSPDVNRLYYDPRIKYKRRINADGTYKVAGTLPTSSFPVYFYRNSSGNNVPWPGGSDGATSSSYFGTSTNPAYTPATGLLAVGATAGLSYPNRVSTTGVYSFPKFAARDDCTGAACTLTEERQNYANWKLYHSNRSDLAKTGLGLAFQPQGATFRIGWAKMNADLDDNSEVGSGVGLFTDARKSAFFTWLYGVGASGSTPGRKALDRVGQYYQRADNSGPWSTNPTTATTAITSAAAADSTHVSCRRSYALHMTDGYYNDSFTLTSVDSADSSTITGTYTVGGTVANRSYKYTGTVADMNTRMYRSTTANTMADIAMKYWVTDLRTDLQNRVTPVPATSISEGNPSFWQNMGTYAIGLGIYGTLAQTTTTIAQLKSGTTTWPAPTTNNPSAVDDMWHAAINGRGQMVSAKNADDLTEAIEDMLEEINRVTSTQSGVAASTLSLNTGTRKYTPNYTTGAWIGNVVASNLDPASGAETSVAWQVVGSVTVGTTTTNYNGIPAHGSRKIIAWNGTSYGEFNASNSYVMAGSPTGVYGASTNLINYLRGDQSNENPAGARYRPREALLGDIVNSTPVYIGGAATATIAIDAGVLDMDYEKLPTGTDGRTTYRTYINTKATRTEGVLFVGANDGMLHGFRDTTGAEVFAFVPKAVMPNMHQLAQRTYAHRYFVDGPNVEADACLGSFPCTWTNLLIGTAGAGAKTVFALDVTTPMAMTTTSAKWEIDPSTSGFATLGHVLSDVQTGYTRSGQWVAVFGNGYESAGGQAVLYIVNLNTGALIKSIVVDNTGSNGLGGVRLVRDANKVIVGAYAGDLKGKMWKFDLSSNSASSWSVGLSSSPLWTGPATQPITQAPALVTHPLGGYVVAFGTGKLYQTTDVSTTTTQAMYGIWDSVPFGTTTTPSGVALNSTSTLVLQTISNVITATQVITASNLSTSTITVNYYSVSRNPVDWTTKRGWYIQWPNSGQRVIYPPETLLGRIVAVDTMTPISAVADDPCLQTNRGKAWNYVIEALTGRGPSTNVFDTNGNQAVELTDLAVSGYENTADGRTRYLRNTTRSTGLNTVFTPLSTQQLPETWISCSTLGTCAFVNRTWRQLYLR
ncbi:MAG: hypothetical protein KA316_18385 [Rhodoferax sp.]|nr:hypothetical protein [Rhodoferax sp.]